MLAIVSFMPVDEEIPGVGAINSQPKLKQEMAKTSHQWTCKTCQMSNAQIAKEFMSADEQDEAKAQEDLRKAAQTMSLNLTSEAEKKRRIELADGKQSQEETKTEHDKKPEPPVEMPTKPLTENVSPV